MHGLQRPAADAAGAVDDVLSTHSFGRLPPRSLASFLGSHLSCKCTASKSFLGRRQSLCRRRTTARSAQPPLASPKQVKLAQYNGYVSSGSTCSGAAKVVGLRALLLCAAAKSSAPSVPAVGAERLLGAESPPSLLLPSRDIRGNITDDIAGLVPQGRLGATCGDAPSLAPQQQQQQQQQLNREVDAPPEAGVVPLKPLAAPEDKGLPSSPYSATGYPQSREVFWAEALGTGGGVAAEGRAGVGQGSSNGVPEADEEDGAYGGQHAAHRRLGRPSGGAGMRLPTQASALLPSQQPQRGQQHPPAQQQHAQGRAGVAGNGYQQSPAGLGGGYMQAQGPLGGQQQQQQEPRRQLTGRSSRPSNNPRQHHLLHHQPLRQGALPPDPYSSHPQPHQQRHPTEGGPQATTNTSSSAAAASPAARPAAAASLIHARHCLSRSLASAPDSLQLMELLEGSLGAERGLLDPVCLSAAVCRMARLEGAPAGPAGAGSGIGWPGRKPQPALWTEGNTLRSARNGCWQGGRERERDWRHEGEVDRGRASAEWLQRMGPGTGGTSGVAVTVAEQEAEGGRWGRQVAEAAGERAALKTVGTGFAAGNGVGSAMLVAGPDVSAGEGAGGSLTVTVHAAALRTLGASPSGHRHIQAKAQPIFPGLLAVSGLAASSRVEPRARSTQAAAEPLPADAAAGPAAARARLDAAVDFGAQHPATLQQAGLAEEEASRPTVRPQREPRAASMSLASSAAQEQRKARISRFLRLVHAALWQCHTASAGAGAGAVPTATWSPATAAASATATAKLHATAGPGRGSSRGQLFASPGDPSSSSCFATQVAAFPASDRQDKTANPRLAHDATPTRISAGHSSGLHAVAVAGVGAGAPGCPAPVRQFRPREVANVMWGLACLRAPDARLGGSRDSQALLLRLAQQLLPPPPPALLSAQSTPFTRHQAGHRQLGQGEEAEDASDQSSSSSTNVGALEQSRERGTASVAAAGGGRCAGGQLHWRPGELAMLAWALARAELRPPSHRWLLSYLGAWDEQMLAAAAPSELACLAWALAQWQRKDVGVATWWLGRTTRVAAAPGSSSSRRRSGGRGQQPKVERRWRRRWFPRREKEQEKVADGKGAGRQRRLVGLAVPGVPIASGPPRGRIAFARSLIPAAWLEAFWTASLPRLQRTAAAAAAAGPYGRDSRGGGGGRQGFPQPSQQQEEQQQALRPHHRTTPNAHSDTAGSSSRDMSSRSCGCGGITGTGRGGEAARGDEALAGGMLHHRHPQVQQQQQQPGLLWRASELATLLWSVGCLGLQPPQPWLEAALRAASAIAPTAPPLALATTLHGVARIAAQAPLRLPQLHAPGATSGAHRADARRGVSHSSHFPKTPAPRSNSVPPPQPPPSSSSSSSSSTCVADSCSNSKQSGDATQAPAVLGTGVAFPLELAAEGAAAEATASSYGAMHGSLSYSSSPRPQRPARPPSVPCQSLLAAFSRAYLRRCCAALHWFGPSQVVDLLAAIKALSSSGHLPPPAAMPLPLPHLLDAAAARLQRCYALGLGPRHLLAAACSLAALRHCPPTEWLDWWLGEMYDSFRRGSLHGRDLEAALRALASFGVVPGPTWSAAFMAAAARRLPYMGRTAMTRLLEVMAQAGLRLRPCRDLDLAEAATATEGQAGSGWSSRVSSGIFIGGGRSPAEGPGLAADLGGGSGGSVGAAWNWLADFLRVWACRGGRQHVARRSPLPCGPRTATRLCIALLALAGPASTWPPGPRAALAAALLRVPALRRRRRRQRAAAEAAKHAPPAVLQTAAGSDGQRGRADGESRRKGLRSISQGCVKGSSLTAGGNDTSGPTRQEPQDGGMRGSLKRGRLSRVAAQVGPAQGSRGSTRRAMRTAELLQAAARLGVLPRGVDRGV